MASVLERLLLQLEVDSRGVPRGFARAETQTKQSTGRMARSWKALQTQVVAAERAVATFATTVALVAVPALGFAIKKAVDFADGRSEEHTSELQSH